MHHQNTIECNDFPVYWAGWETSTYRLKSAGWNIAVDYEPAYMMYRLYFHHKDIALGAITAERHFDDMMRHGRLPFVVQHVAPKIEVMRIPAGPMQGNWQEIDARPVQRDVHMMNPDNLFMYAKGDDELLVDSANMEVIDHLEAIKSLQSEKQRELREKLRKNTRQGCVVDAPIPERKVIANVVELKVA